MSEPENGWACSDGEPFLEETIRPRHTDDLLESLGELARRIEDKWREAGFDVPELRLRMILDEAVLNAWIHGNRQDPAKQISIRCSMGDDCILEVVDQGDGFDHGNVADPTEANNITKSSGRGIFILRYFAETVQWRCNGRHVIVRIGRSFNNGS